MRAKESLKKFSSLHLVSRCGVCKESPWRRKYQTLLSAWEKKYLPFIIANRYSKTNPPILSSTSSKSSSFEWRTLRWRQIDKDEYYLFYSSFSFYKNLGFCLYCCRWPSFPRKENDSRSEENISKRMSVQLAILKILKLKLGSEAWGKKTKEITSRLRDEWYIFLLFPPSPPPPSLGAMLEF